MDNHVFGRGSLANLATCDDRWPIMAHRAVKACPFDHAVICGFRGEGPQDAAYMEGNSDLRWPDSKHNYMKDGKPYSLAIDVAPWIDGHIPWEDTHKFAVLYGCYAVIAYDLGHVLKWGGNFKLGGNPKKRDYTHMELVDAKK